MRNAPLFTVGKSLERCYNTCCDRNDKGDVLMTQTGVPAIITEREKPGARIVPLTPSVEMRVQELIQAGLLAWSGHKLVPMAPVARIRGKRTVANLLLEDRE
jgi:antitoxin (DNA-binding transcriptional repressor) of toxin-antitoxin stability system